MKRLWFLILMAFLPARFLYADVNAASPYFAEAERALLLAEAAYARVQDRFEVLEQDPDASPEQVLAMESYVNEMAKLVALRRQTLADLEAMAGVDTPAEDPEVTAGMEAFDSAVASLPGTGAPESEAEKLDREFAASLEAFDGMILAHNEKLAAQMDARLARGEVQAGAQQTAISEAEALLRSMGVDPGTQAGTETSGRESAEVTDSSRATETGETVAAAGTAQPGSAAGGASDRAPRGDEDIVARQLREAAEKETDPVLREKLWKEYEAYLDGQL